MCASEVEQVLHQRIAELHVRGWGRKPACAAKDRAMAVPLGPSCPRHPCPPQLELPRRPGGAGRQRGCIHERGGHNLGSCAGPLILRQMLIPVHSYQHLGF